MTPAEARIHCLRMRGRRGDLARARGPFLAGLDRMAWPETSEVLHLRCLRLKGRGGELAGLLADAVARLGATAPSGWSASAETASAVRFSHARDRRACLLRDLLLEQAADRWYWSTHPALAKGSLAQAVQAVLLEVPLDLPDLVDRATVDHPFLRSRLWETLLPGQAEELLIRVAEATGWSPGLWTALASLRQSGAPTQGTPAPLFGEVLSALADDWPRLARHLGTPRGGALLAESCRRRRAMGMGGELGTPPPNPGSKADAGSTPLSLRRPTSGQESPGGRPTPQASRRVRREVREQDSACHLINPSSDIDLHTKGPTPQTRDEPGAEREASTPLDALQPAGDPRSEPWTGFLTTCAGWFYLLNLLGSQRLEGGLEDLVSLGLTLGLVPDDSLRDFFCVECEQEWASLALREAPEDLDDLLALGRKRYGGALEEHSTFALRARVVVTACHLAVHFPAGAVQLSVRRVGLDVNPGWLPWLGRTVTFHYGTPEAP